jgi:acyl-CoA reductase-like NAD-dependent aldehyde dehydrogenase
MKRWKWIPLLAVVTALAVGGCGKKQDETPAAGAGDASGAATETSTSVMDEAKESAAEAVEQAQEAAEAAMEKAEGAADTAVAKAKELLEQAKEYLAERDLDSIEPIIEKLRGLKDSLPDELREQIENLERTFGLAKASSGGIEIPKENPFKK